MSKSAVENTHLAEDGLVGLGEELGQLLGVAQVERQPVDAQAPGVQVLLLAQLVDVHPLHHQRAVALRNQCKADFYFFF